MFKAYWESKLKPNKIKIKSADKSIHNACSEYKTEALEKCLKRDPLFAPRNRK